MTSYETERDRRLLPVTRSILNDIVVNGGGEPITYGEFARRATRLSTSDRVIPVQVGRMLDAYAASLTAGEEDLSHLVVNGYTGEVGKAYPNRGRNFVRAEA